MGIAEDRLVAKAPPKAQLTKGVATAATAEKLKLLAALRSLPEHRRTLSLRSLSNFRCSKKCGRNMVWPQAVTGKRQAATENSIAFFRPKVIQAHD